MSEEVVLMGEEISSTSLISLMLLGGFSDPLQSLLVLSCETNTAICDVSNRNTFYCPSLTERELGAGRLKLFYYVTQI